MLRLGPLVLIALGAGAVVVRPSAKSFQPILNSSERSARVQAWVKSKVSWIDINTKPRFMEDTRELTAIVTHAGKNHQEYIDMCIMLGRALTKYAPDVPKVAMIIAGMRLDYQVLLRQAGWRVLKVEDVDPCGEGIQHCDARFTYRWKDSFEKLNIFRLPFARVLFLDADTYVFNDGINFLLNSTLVPDGHVAMAPDGCKTNLKTGGTEYNSGVMLFKPSLETFQSMLEMISVRSGDEMLDQNIINDVFDGKVVELDKKFDCIDPVGVPPGLRRPCKTERICQKKEVVISHFTGMFKPTKANPFYLRLVQQPASFKATCENTNHGGCQKWAEYYCSMHQQRKHLTPELQEALETVGGCCLGHHASNPECTHSTSFNESTDSCPRVVDFSTKDAELPWMSEYYISNMVPTAFHDHRPIYQSTDKEVDQYIYYIASKRNWMIGPNPTVDLAMTYAHADALCPHDANNWKLLNNDKIWQSRPGIDIVPTEAACPWKLDVKAGSDLPASIADTSWTGTYILTAIAPQPMHGGKPIFKKEGAVPMFLYFQQAKGQWVISPNYKAYTSGAAFTKGEAFCPKESLKWQVKGLAGHVAATLLISDITLGDVFPAKVAAEEPALPDEEERNATVEDPKAVAEPNAASDQPSTAAEVQQAVQPRAAVEPKEEAAKMAL